jgi:hypothetical protein
MQPEWKGGTMERRKSTRRKFTYYMRMMNENTGEAVGHLADISPVGFKLDSVKPIPVNREYGLRIELNGQIANQKYMVFAARSKWCRPDPIDTTSYNAGFEITRMTPGDLGIFARIFELYGAQTTDKVSNLDYLWK